MHFFESEYPGGQHTNGPRVYYVFCEGCLISTANLTSHSQVKHIAAWNTRHIDREMDEQREQAARREGFEAARAYNLDDTGVPGALVPAEPTYDTFADYEASLGKSK